MQHAMFTSAVPAVVKTVISGILFGCCQACAAVLLWTATAVIFTDACVPILSFVSVSML